MDPASASSSSSSAAAAPPPPRKFPNFPPTSMSLPGVPANVFHAHLTQPSPFSEHIPQDSPFGHGSTPSSTLAQRRATFAGPSFGNSLTGAHAAAAAEGGSSVPMAPGGSAPGTRGPLDHVREEEEDDAPAPAVGSATTTSMPGSFAAFSFSGSPSAGSPPEGSPFDENVPAVPAAATATTATTATGNKFPPPAASAGTAQASADDLVVPSYALGRRTSVSAESLVPSAALAGGGANASRLPPIHDADTTPTLGSTAGGGGGGGASLAPKTAEQLDRIKSSISNNFLFRNLDEEQERDVLAAMREVSVAPGHVVIEQGAAGDFFYVVEDGEFDIYVKKGDATQQQHEGEEKWGKKVHTAVPGGSFGELALMYK